MSKFSITPEMESEARTRNFIDVGIHDNVYLKNIEYGLSPNNNKFMVFTFEKDGKQLTHTEWEPSDNDSAVLFSKIANQMKRLKHIATKYVPNNEFKIDADDFESFAKAYIALLKGKYETKPVRIKVVYSNSGFTTLPKYVPFIESMEVPAEKSNLEILSIDRMTRESVGHRNQSTSDENPFEHTEDDEELKALPEKTEEPPF